MDTIKSLISSALKPFVRAAYDLQKVRIQIGNRIVANFMDKLGIKPGKKAPGGAKKATKKQAKSIWKMLKAEHTLMTDGMATFPTEIIKNGGSGIISSMVELVLVDSYFRFKKDEERSFKQLEMVLQEYPIYTEYLQHVPGVGPKMAGVLLSEYDIYKAKYPSSMHQLGGLGVWHPIDEKTGEIIWVDEDGNDTGQGQGKYKQQLIDVEYIDKKGKKQWKKSITYNPFLKSKLLGVLGPSFLKQCPTKKCPNKETSKYKTIYDLKKAELRIRPEYQILPVKNREKGWKGHTHAMALRYCVKMFICDLYVAWKELEGLTVHPPYDEARRKGTLHQHHDPMFPRSAA